MEIERFMQLWIDGQCRKFAADIEEMETLLAIMHEPGKEEDERKEQA